jgi:hypothetical protein
MSDRLKALQDMVVRSNALLDRLKASGQIVDAPDGYFDHYYLDDDDDIDDDEPDYLAAIHDVVRGKSP